MLESVVEQTLKHWNSRLLSIKFPCVTLWHMSIGTGVVRTIALQQIDHTPHAKASAEGNNQRLQSVDGRRKELHIASISPGNTRT